MALTKELQEIERKTTAKKENPAKEVDKGAKLREKDSMGRKLSERVKFEVKITDSSNKKKAAKIKHLDGKVIVESRSNAEYLASMKLGKIVD